MSGGQFELLAYEAAVMSGVTVQDDGDGAENVVPDVAVGTESDVPDLGDTCQVISGVIQMLAVEMLLEEQSLGVAELPVSQLLCSKEDRFGQIYRKADRLRPLCSKADRLRLLHDEADRLRLIRDEADRLRLFRDEADRLWYFCGEADRLRLL